MITKLDIFPNELFLNIFSYLSWDEILISLWSLNKRISFLICFIFSKNKNGITLNRLGLSYKNLSSTLFPIILNSSILSSSIKSIHFDGKKLVPFDFISESIFSDNDKSVLRFPSLKSLYITRCLLSQELIQILSLLIRHHLNELTLTFGEHIYNILDHEREPSLIISNRENIQTIFQQFLCQVFSDQCQLTYFHLDTSNLPYAIGQCLNSRSVLQSNIIFTGHQSYSLTLRHLYINLDDGCFLQQLIEYAPNLEQISVCFRNSLNNNYFSRSNIQTPILSNANWFDKIPKLESFKLKSCIQNDLEFVYLKWLLNNVNYIKKLEVYVYSGRIWKPDQMIWRSLIDASFIRQHCLPDKIINLKDFQFYICAECQLSLSNIEKIINSFKINPFFISNEWKNVKWFYNEYGSNLHLFSSICDQFQLFEDLFNCRYISHNLSNIRHIRINFDSSLYSFFEQIRKLCPYLSSITIHTGWFIKRLDTLTTLFKGEQQNLNNIQIANVTKLRFGFCGPLPRRGGSYQFTDEDKIYAKTFAYLISMTVQLKYLFVEKLQWLLYIIQNKAFNDLRENALSTVRYAEFVIPSCNSGSNESIHIGEDLVPFLSSYMPHLQTLRLWRPDDFPWTSLRSKFESKPRFYAPFIKEWKRSLETSQSIDEHVSVFEQDLCGLVEQLKQFVFIDIHGNIPLTKVKPYRLMAQSCFPNSQIDVQISRFRLWL